MVRDTQYSDSESDAGSVDEETARGSVPGFLAEGNIHANRGDWSRAADSFTKAITMDATNRTALIGRTKCYIAAGKPELAIKVCLLWRGGRGAHIGNRRFSLQKYSPLPYFSPLLSPSLGCGCYP